MGSDPDLKAETWITRLLLEAREQKDRYLRHFRPCSRRPGSCAASHKMILKRLLDSHARFWEMEREYRGDLHPWAAEKCKLIGLMAECVIAAESSGWAPEEIFESARSVVKTTHPKLRRKEVKEHGQETA